MTALVNGVPWEGARRATVADLVAAWCESPEWGGRGPQRRGGPEEPVGRGDHRPERHRRDRDGGGRRLSRGAGRAGASADRSRSGADRRQPTGTVGGDVDRGPDRRRGTGGPPTTLLRGRRDHRLAPLARDRGDVEPRVAARGAGRFGHGPGHRRRSPGRPADPALPRRPAG